MTNSGQSLKMFISFEVSGSYKNIVSFLGLFFVDISVLSILIFFRTKAREKIKKNAV